jgi:Uma2 family endonuclease
MTIIQREEQEVRIPEFVSDLAGFRRWAKSDAFPERGRYAYLDGELWVDASMEKLIHNGIKTEVSNVVGSLTKKSKFGNYLGDGVLLTNLDVGLSTEPDGMFISYEAIKSGRAILEDAEESLEVLGVPDMVLEVVSGTSIRKDTVVLRRFYALAGIREYWLADSRIQSFSFEILHRRGKGYAAAAVERGGWIESRVFGRSFRLVRELDEVGMAVFRLENK